MRELVLFHSWHVMRAAAPLLILVGWLLPVVFLASGCTSWMQAQARGRSPLRPARMSPDAVAIEIVFARFPLGDRQANEEAWREIDEQHFPPETRRELARQGFRVGLVAGQVPLALARLLDMKEDAPIAGEPSQVASDEIGAEPRVSGRHVQLRAGATTEVIASGVQDEWTVLSCEPDGLCGKTYQKAQGILEVRVRPGVDGRVAVDVTPELQYGDPSKRWIGAQGMLRLDTARQKHVLKELALSATLAPGEMIVLTALPDRQGSVGSQFFTDDNSGQPEQKLLLIRLSQTQHDGLFSDDEILPLDNLPE